MPKTKTKKRPRTSRSKRLPRGPRGGIELLLVQSVEKLGEPGEVIEVRPGYANNYLLPQGLATIATDHHKRMVEKHRARLLQIQHARIASLKATAMAISKQSVTLEANANDEGHLYGSVGPVEIASALKQHEFSVAPDQVRLEGPLKELGLYTVKVHLGSDVDADLKVWVVPSATEEPAEEAQ